MTSPIIVADSSPLIALAIIEQLELLPRLYRHVLAPPTVWHEVTVQGAGLPGALAVSQVNWLDIRVPDPASVDNPLPPPFFIFRSSFFFLFPPLPRVPQPGAICAAKK
jgi:hypothetical protein